MITAVQARLNFADPVYVEAISSVTEAILAASEGNHKVTTTMPTSGRNGALVSLRVKQDLQDNGFDVILTHLDNGFSELDVRW